MDVRITVAGGRARSEYLAAKDASWVPRTTAAAKGHCCSLGPLCLHADIVSGLKMLLLYIIVLHFA